MSYLKLPKRVFNSPLIRYANFEDGSHINLIRLTKPYANGVEYAIHETTKSPFVSNKLIKKYEDAIKIFNHLVKNAQLVSSLVSSGVTGNTEF
jgi:hypothetical protein